MRQSHSAAGTICLTCVAAVLTLFSGHAQQAGASGEWRSYNGDLASTKYSSLDQINKSNVARLQVAWRHPALDPQLKQQYPKLTATNYYRATPLMAGGALYVQNALGLAQALDPATARVLWTQEPLTTDMQGLSGGPASRGVAYWRGGQEERILTVRRNYLFALDAKTGRTYADFGENGKVDLSAGLGPFVTQFTWAGAPLVIKDLVVIGANGQDFPTRKEGAPGDVRAFDVRTGKLRWTFHVVPRPGEFGNETWLDDSWSYTGNTNLWSMMSADPELGYLYLPLTSPTNDWYGGHRPGDNLFSDSLVCVDAETGKRIWHFQIVHHDVWDYDLPAAPILTDITVGGTKIKAVVQLTKTGFAFVFDRVTGKPVWPIEERKVPQSSVPGEKTSPTQPFPTKPPAFTRQGVSIDDLIDFTPQLRAEAKAIADGYILGPMFTPPSIQGTQAGEKKGVLQVPGWVGGADWNGGAFDPETGRLYVPSIQASVISVLKAGDPKITDFRFMNPLSAPQRDVVGPQGLPLLKPPYGSIVAIDLNRGEIAWSVPNGDGPRNHPLLKDLKLPPLGQPGRAGPLLTRTLLFVGEGDPIAAVTPPGGGGTKFRAYDKVTGAVLWETDLNAGTTGSPMTYSVNGKQFIVVAVGSAKYPGELVALALP
jgi:quinoprotein glucose dehydrogenase